jgi:DTW domain-containing protein YfiP
VLIYPSGQALPLGDWMIRHGTEDVPRAVNLLFIDASWRKARKIWHSSPLLQSLPCIRLAAQAPSGYRIRKVPGDGYLSTIESIVLTLTSLDNTPAGKYQPMLDVFNTMIERQIDRMGQHTYRKNYLDNNANRHDEN